MHFNMADIGAFHCYQAELMIIITINSSFKTGTGSRHTGCITRPLSHCRKLISCQLAIFLPLKSLVQTTSILYSTGQRCETQSLCMSVCVSDYVSVSLCLYPRPSYFRRAIFVFHVFHVRSIIRPLKLSLNVLRLRTSLLR